MIVLDTQADPQVGIKAVNRLVSVEKVPVFITAWSSVVRAVAPIANDNKVVELSIGANSPDIAKLGDYVYTTFPLADVDVAAVAKVRGREDRQEESGRPLHQQRHRHLSPRRSIETLHQGGRRGRRLRGL